jgi:hypothetical protein
VKKQVAGEILENFGLGMAYRSYRRKTKPTGGSTAGASTATTSEPQIGDAGTTGGDSCSVFCECGSHDGCKRIPAVLEELEDTGVEDEDFDGEPEPLAPYLCGDCTEEDVTALGLVPGSPDLPRFNRTDVASAVFTLKRLKDRAAHESHVKDMRVALQERISVMAEAAADVRQSTNVPSL